MSLREIPRKRTRAGGVHVKTGCKTCKIRHVKCDEGKPSCVQCTKTGRVCDGYNKTLSIRVAQPKVTAICPPHPTVPNAQILAPRLSGTNDEARSFEFFQHVLGPSVFDAFSRLTAVEQLTMQLSHSDSVVKHAVVALGSIGEQLMKDRSHSLKRLDHDKGLHFAHVQNVKAIQQLRKQLSCGEQQSIELTLLCCFLFIIFDFFYGDEASSHAHLKAGLKILHNCIPQGTPSTVSTNLEISKTLNPILGDFARIFTVMDLHAAVWLGLSSFQSPPLADVSNGVLSDKPISGFKTLEDASYSLNFQLMRIHVFHHSLAACKSTYNTLGETPFHIQARREEYLFDLRAWSLALDTFLDTTAFTAECARRTTLMRMIYYSTLINLSTSMQPCGVAIYRTYTHVFKQIVNLAVTLLRPATTCNRTELLRIIAINNAERDPTGLPMFAFVSGAIQPLHMVADKCCDTTICFEAIELLEETPWREGAWDSTVMANIARRKLQQRNEDHSPSN